MDPPNVVMLSRVTALLPLVALEANGHLPLSWFKLNWFSHNFSQYSIEWEYPWRIRSIIIDAAVDGLVMQTWWHHQIETFSALLAFVRGIHRSPVNSPHKGQWHAALVFSLICVWINDWVNNGEAGDLRCYHAHYDVTVMKVLCYWLCELGMLLSSLRLVTFHCYGMTERIRYV